MFTGFVWLHFLFAFIYFIITSVTVAGGLGDGVVHREATVTSGLRVIVSLFLSIGESKFATNLY